MKKRILTFPLVTVLLMLLIVSQAVIAQNFYNVKSSVSLTIRVHNVSGLKMPQSGGTIKVILYDEAYNYVKQGTSYYSGGESYVSVSLGTVSPANYIIEVYNEPNTEFAYSEFWGSDFIQADGNAKDFYRHVPYVVDVKANGKSVYDVLTTTMVEKTVKMEILVKNPDPYAKTVKVRLMIRKQGTTNIWFNKVSSQKSVSAGGVESFIFYPKPEEKGLHEFYVVVYDWNDASIITDQHDWYRAFYARYPYVHLTSRTTDGFNDLGSITFDGTKYYLPEDIDVSPGSHTATANDPSGANAGYEFYRWETSGGVSVSSTTSRSVTVTVTDDGTLRAVFIPPVYLTSETVDGQQNVGTITFDGVTYDLPARVAKYSPSTYWATANPPTGYTFLKWETYQAVSVEDPYSQTTKVHVDGAGTLKAIFQQRIISLEVTDIHTDKSEYTLQDNIIFSFTVKNTGTETVTFRPALKVRGPNGEEFTSGPSGINPDKATLAPGQSMQFSSSKNASLWFLIWGQGSYEWGVLLTSEDGNEIFTDTGYIREFRIDNVIIFSGYRWIVKHSPDAKIGPGSNYWTAENVWVDENGQLHLRIAYKDGRWYCAEVYTEDPLGHGTYVFYVASKQIDSLDENVILGLFSYENDEREVDIEFSPSFDIGNGENARFTIQPQPPYSENYNQKSFRLELTGDYSTHWFTWDWNFVFFESFHGHYPYNSPPESNVIIIWRSDLVRIADNAHAHINLWLRNGNPPTDGNEVEIVIKKFEFYPVQGLDSDSKRELIIWRPGNGRWYTLRSLIDYDLRRAFIVKWGSGTLNDVPLIGYVDQDSMEDLVIWRPGNGVWYILKSSNKYEYDQALKIQWGSGALNDAPLLGDIDGDNIDDLVIWRPGNGRWYILKSSAGYSYPEAFIKQWGSGALNDIPLLGDIDGDGKDDLIIWRPTNGYWYILKSSTGYDYSQAFIKQWGSGALNDIPFIDDFDGDGKDDLIIWRPGNGYWYILKSSANYDYGSAFVKQWGSGTLDDIPLTGDLDGDGKADLIIWRPGNGKWYVLRSSTNYDYSQAFIKQWGTDGDVPR